MTGNGRAEKDHSFTRKPMKCYNCNRFGHPSKECTLPREVAGVCFTCNEKGHLARDSPSKIKNHSQVATVYEDPGNAENFRQGVKFEFVVIQERFT